MGQVAVISSRQLAATNRWDAEYHIALKHNESLVNRLMAMPEADFLKLRDLTPHSPRALKVVCRGTTKKISSFANYCKQEQAVLIAISISESTLEKDAAALEEQARLTRQLHSNLQKLIPQETKPS